MAYTPQELVAFIAIEGDHFETLTASPHLYTKRVGEPIPDDDESVYANPATFDDLVMASGGGERSGPFLFAVAEGWTFLATPWEFPLAEPGFALRLAKQFGARTFQIDFSGSEYGNGFLLTDPDGAPVRFISRMDFYEKAEASVLGDPLSEESDMPAVWDVDDVLRVFNRLGGPSYVGMENFDRPFEKTAWFEMTTDIVPPDEREAVRAFEQPFWAKTWDTTANDASAFTLAAEPAGGDGKEDDESYDEFAYYDEADARRQRGTKLYYRTVYALWAVGIAGAVAAYYYFF